MTWKNSQTVKTIALIYCKILETSHFTGMKSLKDIYLQHCDFCEKFTNPGNIETLLLKNCKNIHEIDFSSFDGALKNLFIYGNISDEMFESISNLSSLESLVVRNLKNIDIIGRMKKLKFIYVKNLRKREIEQIEQKFPGVYVSIPQEFAEFI